MTRRMRTAIQPESTGLELARGSRGVTTPVPCVYLPVSLTAPGPSGSTEPARLCRGCSRPHRRPPARTSSSFTPPLRRQGNGRPFTSIRNNSASWRTQAASSFTPPLRRRGDGRSLTSIRNNSASWRTPGCATDASDQRPGSRLVRRPGRPLMAQLVIGTV